MNTAACLFNSPYKVSLLLLIVLCLSCTSNTDTERHQKNRNNIVNIQERIKEINTEENPITAWGIPHILGDYLLVSDYKSPDKLVYTIRTISNTLPVQETEVKGREKSQTWAELQRMKQNKFFT